MSNFIVCDDNKEVRYNIKKIIDQVMMKNKLAYDVYLFEDYDNEFMKIMNSPLSCKIYILDIETPTRSGIDIARLIRSNDINSVIIFLTSHDELGYTILKNEFMFLSFICKFDNYELKLKSAINKALKIVGKKSMVRFEDGGIIYTIPLCDILYITRDSFDRKCLIKTDYAEYKVGKSLTELFTMVEDGFVQTHRACIVNGERIRVFNSKEREIIFDNGLKLDLVSNNYKKGVKEYVANN